MRPRPIANGYTKYPCYNVLAAVPDLEFGN